MMGHPVYHVEVDRTTGHVCSIHWGDSDLLDVRQTTTGRQVIPIIDAKLAEAMRVAPENYAVRDNAIVELPENERTCRMLHVIDQMQGPDKMDLLIAKQQEVIDLLKALPEAVGQATEAAMRRAIN